MDVDKAASKGFGFLSLFDWNKKSKKRLFADGSGGGSSSSGKAGVGNGVEGGTPSSQSNSILEDDMVGVSSMKGSSEHSFTSSVIDEEGHVRKGPSVVARLMGLDSMPTASSSRSYSMPLTMPQSSGSKVHDEWIGKSHIGSPHKMPSSPIDRFKMEVLPLRSAKRPFSVAQYKLLSPMKNPTNISGRNAADIMEVSSRIIGPGFENSNSYRFREAVFASPVRTYNPREIIRVPQGSQKINEVLRKRDGSASPRPIGRKPLNRILQNSGSIASFRTSQSNGGSPAGPKVKGKTTSPAVQATNVQIREVVSKSSRKTIIHKDIRAGDKIASNHQNGNNQRVMAGSSNVLVQNNRKQNAMVVKHKVNSRPVTSSQQQNGTCSIVTSPKKVRAVSTRAANSNGGNKKEELQSTNHVNKRLNSSNKTISRPRRLPDGRKTYLEKGQSSDKNATSRSQRHIQHNIVIDEQSSFSRDNKKISTDIVSFTFTSPVDKSLPGSHFANQLVETQFLDNAHSGSASSNKSNTKNGVIDGDYLGLLLEQKLRELTSGIRSPYFQPIKGVSISASSSTLEEDTSLVCETSSVASADCEREPLKSFKNEQVDFSQTDIASQSGQSTEAMEYVNNIMSQRKSEHLHLSPLSILEASVSTETCSSSESWISLNGTRLFIPTGAKSSDPLHLSDVPELDGVSDYSDTASSVTATTTEIPPSEISSSCYIDICGQDMDFVREILNVDSLKGGISSHCLERCSTSDILDPGLFEQLNCNIRLVGDYDGKNFRMRRRLLFDCVNEFLSTKCTYYFSTGYSSWFKGVAVLRKLSAEELYEEMTSLKIAEEWMVDELVDKEMSSPLGRWVDFEIESYEAGGDIAKELLSSLIDETVAYLLT